MVDLSPSDPREALLLRVRAREALKRRRAEGGIRYFRPSSEEQERALRFTKRGALVIGGNRSGKTEVGAAETVYRLLGNHPFKPTHRPPIRVWACSQDLPGVKDQPHTQLEKLRKWLPRDALRGGSWEKSYSPMARTLNLANGSQVEFKGYDQGLLKFESSAVHWIWLDEEPPDKRIWSSCLLRLLDYSGQWMLTATPVLSLQGKGWIEELWDARLDPDCGFDWFQLFTLNNTYLPRGEAEALFANLTDEERAVRANGAFARLGGKVLAEFDPARHLCDPWLPPASWRHYLVIDPGGRNPTGGLFAAADPDGGLHLYAEHYLADELPAFHVGLMHAVWVALWTGQAPPELDVLIDPAGWSRERTIAGGQLDRSVVEEYQIAARDLGWTGFNPRPAVNVDVFAWRVKRYLKAGLISIGRHLQWWQWEADRWTYQSQRSGLVASEKELPNRPIDKFDHLAGSCTRYLVNELPEPLAAPVETPDPRSPEATWDRLLKRRREAVRDVD
jgi:phage terminase large subunit-like protein